MGDLCNLIIPGDKRWHPEEINPEFHALLQKNGYGEAVSAHMARELNSVKGRMIAMLAGNHENSYSLSRDQAFTELLARKLDAPYGGESCSIELVFTDGKRRVPYRIYARHGKTGATTEAGRMNALKRYVKSRDGGDLYLMGHVHDIISKVWPVVYVDGSRLKHRDVRAVTTGSFLRTFGEGYDTYSERASYEPVPLGNPVVWVQPSTKKTRVED